MTARAFNPDRPCVIGQEWQPDRNTLVPLQNINAKAMVLQASTSDTVEAIWTAIQEMLGKHVPSLAVEVYDITNGGSPALPDFDPVDSTVFLPRDVLTGVPYTASGFHAGAINTLSPYQYVNQTSFIPGTFNGLTVGADTFLFSETGQNYTAGFKFDSVAGALTSRWIIRVRAILNVSNLYFGASVTTGSTVGVVPYIVVDGQQFFGDPQAISQTSPLTTVTFDMTENPVTGMPWTVSDIENFDSGSGAQWGIGFTALGVGSTSSYLTVQQVQLQIDSAATDPRLAIGVCQTYDPGSGTLGHQGWVRILFVSPNDGSASPITLTPNHYYLFLLKSTLGNLVALNGLYAQYPPGGVEDVANPPNWVGMQVTLDPTTRRPVNLLAIGNGFMVGSILEKSSTVMSLDSQPYVFTTPTQGQQVGWTTLANGLFHYSEVSFGQWFRQQFTVDTTTTFGYLQIVVALLSTTTKDPNQALNIQPGMTINIKRNSDDHLMAGPFTINVSDLTAPVTAWQRFGIDIGSVTLTGGVQYYFECLSTANPYVSWQVQVSTSGYGTPPSGPPTGTVATSWGAGIDTMVIYNFGVPSFYPNTTAEIFIASLPPAPGSFTATALGESACHVDGIFLSWTKPVLTCGTHGYYDIQRSDDNGTTWNSIAKITFADAVNFTDWESVRNSQALYRIREVRADGSPSVWSPTVSATATMSVTGLLFVSNEHPDYNVFYPDVGASRSFSFPQNVTIVQPLGQNYQIAMHDLEYRGRTFNASLAIRSQIPGCPPQLVTCDDITLTGADVFNPLQTICRADISYVCVHDEHGDRYFANVTSPTGTWQPTTREIFNLDIQVTELTDTPSTPDVEAAS